MNIYFYFGNINLENLCFVERNCSNFQYYPKIGETLINIDKPKRMWKSDIQKEWFSTGLKIVDIVHDYDAKDINIILQHTGS